MKKLLIVLNIVFLTVVGITATSANPIDVICPQHTIWGAPQIANESSNQYLCRKGYAVNYNYQTKVAYFVVEVIRPENLVRSADRKDDFREDPEVPAQYRVTLKDYIGSGLDRGHMAPAADFMNSADMMSQSFLLTNMMPQNPGNNRGIWKYTEEMTRFYTKKYNTPMYVITGTIFDNTSGSFGNGVRIPSHLYKIVIDPKNIRSIAFMYPNQKLDPKTIESYVVSISQIEAYTSINFSPAIPPQFAPMKNIKANFKDW